MAPTILSLLKTHPVSLKENLMTICDTLGINTSNKPTKAQMQSEIDTFLSSEPDLEPKVREIAVELISEFKERKNSETTTTATTTATAMEIDTSLTCPPPTTHLSISPVNSTSFPTQQQQKPQQQHKSNELKRKLFNGCDDDEDVTEAKRVKPNIPLESSVQTLVFGLDSVFWTTGFVFNFSLSCLLSSVFTVALSCHCFCVLFQ